MQGDYRSELTPDSRLSDRGIRQAIVAGQKMAEFLATTDVALYASSQLMRAIETALWYVFHL